MNDPSVNQSEHILSVRFGLGFFVCFVNDLYLEEIQHCSYLALYISLSFKFPFSFSFLFLCRFHFGYYLSPFLHQVCNVCS